ncbi:MAG: three-Cys-motif partner protein TcmP, partial [Cyanobacteria bacterium P01_E01_bin.42]
MSDEEFWAKPTEASKIKIEIVSKYFTPWSKVILGIAKQQNGLAYVDMFSGRGRYSNGFPSTPIRILQTALKSPDLRNLLHLFFNDGDLKNFTILSEEINSLPNLSLMNYRPKILNIELCPNNLSTILGKIQEINNYPTLFFIDPYGYKGMSLQSIKFLIKGKGN